jgi:putative RNA 2'-phosphotransferase
MSRDSKLLAMILRHDPGSVGLRLDGGGWVGIEALAEALGRHGHALGRDGVLAVAASSDKARFTVSPDGARIRAAQGHSVEVDLGLAPAEPPEVLFHGTAEGAVAAILAEGLRPMARQHVHLSADPATATRVGQRHGRPVVLRVAAGAMRRDGLTLWQADNGVWLTGEVAPRYLSREDVPPADR